MEEAKACDTRTHVGSFLPPTVPVSAFSLVTSPFLALSCPPSLGFGVASAPPFGPIAPLDGSLVLVDFFAAALSAAAVSAGSVWEGWKGVIGRDGEVC